jgi:hypothetical protein
VAALALPEHRINSACVAAWRTNRRGAPASDEGTGRAAYSKDVRPTQSRFLEACECDTGASLLETVEDALRSESTSCAIRDNSCSTRSISTGLSPTCRRSSSRSFSIVV